MKQNWQPEELTQHWTLSSDERELLGNKAGATRLRFVVLLKAFQLDGRFPERREEVSANVVAHLAGQTGVPTEAYSEAEWSERTQRYQRAQIRQHCDFRIFRVEDEPTFVAWLSERVSSPNPEDLKIAAYSHLRSQRIEPPPMERLHRLLWRAVGQREERLVRETAAQLSPATRTALDALVKTQLSENSPDGDHLSLLPVRSELAEVKDGVGAVSVETVLDEIAKLKELRALGLPEALLGDSPAKLITHYRQRAASEKPREI
jgi:uncharacterized protein DUF4158